MPQSPFVLQETKKSFCPDLDCQKPVVLLVHQDAVGPIFYICFHCRRVFQAGMSEVRKERVAI